VAGDVREPVAILLARHRADALDVLHHCEAEGIRINSTVPVIIEIRLPDHVRMRVQEHHESAVADLALLVKGW